MKKSDVIRELIDSDVLASWHWFQWHLMHHVRGSRHPFIEDIAAAIGEIDEIVPGLPNQRLTGSRQYRERNGTSHTMSSCCRFSLRFM
jgi:hypothetical protein